VDAGVRTLGLLKDSTDKSVDRFSSLLNGLLDYLNTLSISQAREVGPFSLDFFLLTLFEFGESKYTSKK
jgi:hypothetical protein